MVSLGPEQESVRRADPDVSGRVFGHSVYLAEFPCERELLQFSMVKTLHSIRQVFAYPQISGGTRQECDNMVANNSLFRVPGSELAIPRAVQDFVSCADPNRAAGVRRHARYGLECIGEGWAPLSVVAANHRSVLRDTPK